jgi:carbonic anhydrase/acetyltransferase-like protein (isoleucine patch superfamily)
MMNDAAGIGRVCIVNEQRSSMPLYSIDGFAPELPPQGEYYIAPNAVLIGRVRLLKNASVWFGAVLRGDNDEIVIGENSNVQDNAVIHTDPGFPVDIGKGVTIGHRAMIHSAKVGDGSLIGMGAMLLNGASIGAFSVVGAGALVPEGRGFPDGVLVLGSPARVVRTLDDAQRGRLAHGAEVYVAHSKSYREGLVRLD